MIDARLMRKSAGYFFFGLALYLLFLIATAPAVWLAEAAARFSSGVVILATPRGTIWGGTAELHAGGAATGVHHLGTLQWSVNPLWFFAGGAQLALQLDGPAARGQGSLRVGPNQRSLRDLTVVFPAQLIALVYPPAAFFAPTGTIELKAPNIDVSRNGLVAVAEGQWEGAGGRFTGSTGLGDYRVELTGRGDTATFRVATLRGNLELTGEGQWHVTGDGDIQFAGSATPRGDATQLEPLLKALGPDLGNGRREIRFNTRIALIRLLGL
jgi:general secretion pathway protein N